MPTTVKANSKSGGSRPPAGYDIKIRRGLIGRLGIEILNLTGGGDTEILLVTDEKVSGLYLQDVIMNCQQCPKPEGTKLRICELLIGSGEAAKNFGTVSKLLEEMAALGLGENCCIVALGGGVVCDAAAWAAGCYMGGVKLVLVPTTLAAMIDCSAGGSAFLNLNAGKNLAGMSRSPSLVLCDIEALKTLPPEEYKSGIAEAFKISLMSGGQLFRIFERGESEVEYHIEKIIGDCIKFRASLNSERAGCIGCEIANAIESLSGYEISHGSALAEAVRIMMKISLKNSWCSEETFQRVIDAMKKNNLCVNFNSFSPSLIAGTLINGRISGRSINLNVLTEIGKCEIKNFTSEDLSML